MSMTDHPSKIEVITLVQRRRRWIVAEKPRMAEETYQPDATLSAVARRHGVSPNPQFTWRELAAQRGLTAAAPAEFIRAYLSTWPCPRLWGQQQRRPSNAI